MADVLRKVYPMTDAEKIRRAVDEDTYVGDVAPLLAGEVECPDAELARVTRERDAAIRRQLHAASDGGRWYVADGVRVEDGERLGPFCGEDAAFASVLAWIRWALDPEGVAMPEYTTVDEEGNS
jgi:hypothetical protein